MRRMWWWKRGNSKFKVAFIRRVSVVAPLAPLQLLLQAIFGEVEGEGEVLATFAIPELDY